MDGKSTLSLDEVYDLETGNQKQREGPRSWISVSGFVKSFFPSQESIFYLLKIAEGSKRTSDPTYKYYRKPLGDILEMWRTNTKKRDQGTHMHLELEYYVNLYEADPELANYFLLGRPSGQSDTKSVTKDEVVRKKVPPRSDLGIAKCGQTELIQAKAYLDTLRLTHIFVSTEKRFFAKEFQGKPLRLCGTCDAVLVERASPLKEEELSKVLEYERNTPLTLEEAKKRFKFSDKGSLVTLLLDYKRSPEIETLAEGKMDFLRQNKPCGPDSPNWNPFWVGIGPCSKLETCRTTDYNLALNSYKWLIENCSQIKIEDQFFTFHVSRMILLECHPENVGYRSFQVPDWSKEVQQMIDTRIKCLEENKFIAQDIPGVYQMLFPKSVKWKLTPPEMAYFNERNSNPSDFGSIARRIRRQNADLARITRVVNLDRKAAEQNAKLKDQGLLVD
jgi:hypothetical protein